MSIGVQSYVELYTTLIGWQMYDQMWMLLSQTGAAYLPFLGLLLKNMIVPYESQETKTASGTSLRRMEVDVILMLLIILFGVSPFMPLDASMVSYTPMCQSHGDNTYHPGDTGTTYDKAFAIPQGDIKVPIWWYAVLSFSAGTTAAANTMIGCVPDYRKMITQVDMAQIQNPAVKQELQQFTSDCYLPARAHYLEDSKTTSDTNALIQQEVNEYGADDTEWLGSHSFQDSYYQTLKASQPIPGFSYDSSQDVNAGAYQNNTSLSPPAFGSPDCASWWNTPDSGLADRLKTALPNTFFTDFHDILNVNKQLNDDVVKRLVTNGGADYHAADAIQGTNDLGTKTFEDIGLIFSQTSSYPTIYAISQAAPIVQGLLLLMVFTFLPILLVFAGYKPAAFANGAIIIFSLYFWSFIWQFVGWVDSVLMQTLFDRSLFSLVSPNETLVTIIIGFLQIAAPLFWFGFMSALGIAAGHFISAASAAMSSLAAGPANQIGQQASSAVGRFVTPSTIGKVAGMMGGGKKTPLSSSKELM